MLKSVVTFVFSKRYQYFFISAGFSSLAFAIPTSAQTGLSACIQGLRNQGFTRDKAAEYCVSASQSPNHSPHPVFQTPSDPEAVSQCMNDLLYEKKRVCYFMGNPQQAYANVHCQYGNGEWRVEQGARTAISEYSAAQACQNAR